MQPSGASKPVACEMMEEPALPQMGPSSERSAQSTLPLQILSGVRHTEVSLAQGYLGGLQTAVSQDSSSERSSQSMSPSHTQLFVMHLPLGSRAHVVRMRHLKRDLTLTKNREERKKKPLPLHFYVKLHGFDIV